MDTHFIYLMHWTFSQKILRVFDGCGLVLPKGMQFDIKAEKRMAKGENFDTKWLRFRGWGDFGT